jgi:hypothetical protein
MSGMRFKTGHGFYAYTLFAAALTLPPALVFRERLYGVLFYLALVPALRIMGRARFSEVLGWQCLAISIGLCLLAMLSAHLGLGYEAAIEGCVVAFALLLLLVGLRGIWRAFRRGEFQSQTADGRTRLTRI